jgi:hypothetical protein
MYRADQPKFPFQIPPPFTINGLQDKKQDAEIAYDDLSLS